jgi:F-type H+-transporting ATPase subunit epsilon
MADTIALEIVTPDGVKLSERVAEVTAPSVNGEFGVLPGHRPMLATLSTGLVTYVLDGQKHEVAIGAGFAEVVDDKVILLTDRFSTKADIDPVLVRKELKETDEALERHPGETSTPEYAELVARELWLAALLDLYGDPPPPRLRTQNELSLGGGETYAQLGDGESSEAGESKSETVH